MRKKQKSADDILTLLNERSWLLGIWASLAGRSIPGTRERNDDAATLSLEMYGYRSTARSGCVPGRVGRCGSRSLRRRHRRRFALVAGRCCPDLDGWRLEFDSEVNKRSIAGMRASRRKAHACMRVPFPSKRVYRSQMNVRSLWRQSAFNFRDFPGELQELVFDIDQSGEVEIQETRMTAFAASEERSSLYIATTRSAESPCRHGR